MPCVALCQVPRLIWGCDPHPQKKSPMQGSLPAPRQGSALGEGSRGKGSDSRWAAELGARSRGCVWGCALGAARTALPAARCSQDFFLCRDSLLPRTSPFGKFIDSWRPGLGLSCGRGQDVVAAGQAPDAWAVVGRDAPLPAGLPEPGCLPRLSGTARGVARSLEGTEHRGDTWLQGRGRAGTWAVLGKGGAAGRSTTAPSASPQPCLQQRNGTAGMGRAPPGRGPRCPPGPPGCPCGQAPPRALREGGSPRHNKAANVNGTLIPRGAALPAPNFPPR